LQCISLEYFIRKQHLNPKKRKNVHFKAHFNLLKKYCKNIINRPWPLNLVIPTRDHALQRPWPYTNVYNATGTCFDMALMYKIKYKLYTLCTIDCWPIKLRWYVHNIVRPISLWPTHTTHLQSYTIGTLRLQQTTTFRMTTIHICTIERNLHNILHAIIVICKWRL